MIYGYARVSSKGQERYGNSLEDQTNQLRAAGCGEIFCESYTGTKLTRPEFTKLLGKLKPGDTLVVTKLDRFARTAGDGATLIQSLLGRGVNVNILNMGKADNTPMGKLLVTVLLAFAEFERDMIVERTTTGKAVARAKNPDWREGRKPVQVTKEEFWDTRERVVAGQMTATQASQKLGVCRATWYKLVKMYA